MKKQTLLGAAALTTLAVAGAANAGTLSLNTGVAGNTIKASQVVATEVVLDSTTSKGVIGLALQPTATAILPSGNSLLKVSLTGGAKFGAAVNAGAVVANAGCAPTTVVSTGGAAGDSTVTFLVSNLGGCTNAVPLHLAIPVQVSGTSTVNVDTLLTTEAGTYIDGGTASTTNLIKFAKAFDVTFAADTVETKALLPSFKTLSANTVLGKATIVATAGATNGIHGASAPVTISDVTAAKFTLTGDFTTLDVSVTGTGVTVPLAAETKAGSGIATVSTSAAPAAGDYTVAVAAKGTAPIIKGSAYTIAADLTLAPAFTAPAQFGPSPLQTVTREGSSYLLPWVASGALATTSTSNTVVRIANTGAATGAVSLELLTSSKGVAASTTLVPVATSIAKGGELVLTSASLQTALGADFGRGDIRVTVEGAPADLIVRRFVQSTVNGALSEVSLGRSAAGAEPVN